MAKRHTQTHSREYSYHYSPNNKRNGLLRQTFALYALFLFFLICLFTPTALFTALFFFFKLNADRLKIKANRINAIVCIFFPTHNFTKMAFAFAAQHFHNSLRVRPDFNVFFAGRVPKCRPPLSRIEFRKRREELVPTRRAKINTTLFVVPILTDIRHLHAPFPHDAILLGVQLFFEFLLVHYAYLNTSHPHATWVIVPLGGVCTMGFMNESGSEQLPLEPENARPHKDADNITDLGWFFEHKGSREFSWRGVNVWHVREKAGLSKSPVSQRITTGLDSYNDSRKHNERPIWFTDVQGSELVHQLERAYGEDPHPSKFPEIVIVETPPHGVDYTHAEKSPLGEAYLKHDLKPFDDITGATERLYRSEGSLLLDQTIEDVFARSIFPEALEEAVFSPIRAETYGIKRKLSVATLIDCGFAHFPVGNEDVEKHLWPYMNDHDPAHLDQLLSDDRLRAIFAEIRRYDPEIADEDYDMLGGNTSHAGFESRGGHKRYLRQIATLAKKLSFDEVKEVMRERYRVLLEDGIARISAKTLADYDRTSREQKILDPVLISLSPDPAFQRHAIEHGANMIPATLEEGDVERMVTLAERMKASEASLERGRTSRLKRRFYKKHESELHDRSELTADTGQELEILDAILKKHGVKKLLDVGCGEGRISGPLAKRGYDIIGLEANENFRKRAEEKIGRENSVITGDIIDYRDIVSAERYDAVTYTWHTILEAYGIGNTMQTLVSAWRALKQGGTIIFDQPTRENKGMEDGWYGDKEGRQYLAYLMDEAELRLVLRMAGFEEPEIRPWTTKPTTLYPEGMRKWTIVAKKPEIARGDDTVQ